MKKCKHFFGILDIEDTITYKCIKCGVVRRLAVKVIKPKKGER